MAKRHSEMAAFAGRHGLNQVTAKVAEGENIEVHDLRYQIADGYHPYRLNVSDPALAQNFLSIEMPFHDGIVILRHPDRYEPRKDPIMTVDTSVAAELAAAGFPAIAVQPGQAYLIGNILNGARLEDISEDVESEMFSAAGDVSRVMRSIPEPFLRAKAEPFAVVLGRNALVGGWDSQGRSLSQIELMDSLVGLMGGAEYALLREDDLIAGGIYQTNGFSMDFAALPAPAADIGYDGPLIYFEQNFEAALADTDVDLIPEESVDLGLRRIASEVGLCLAVEMAHDASEGWLVGYKRKSGGELESLKVWADEEAGVDD